MNITENFIIGIITYNRYDYLNELILNISNQTVWPKHIYISDNGVGFCLKEKVNIPITIIKNSYNYGTCRSINEIIKLNDNEDILFMCDDNYFIDNTSLEKIYSKFIEEKEKHNIHLIWCNHWASFITSKEWIKCVGLFDDNIWPCYYEDSDMTERIRKKSQTSISHNCIGYIPLNSKSNWEETEVIGNKRGTGEILIAPKYNDFKERNLYYHYFKWKEKIVDTGDMHENTHKYYVEQKDVDLYKFETEYIKNNIKDLKINNHFNNISEFVDDILNLKSLNFKTVVEYKTQRTYMSRLLLFLKIKELVSYDDNFNLSHDMCYHINYLFNFNTTIKLLNSSNIIKQDCDLLVINKDCDLSIINHIDANYILIFSNSNLQIEKYTNISTISKTSLSMLLFKKI